MSINDRQIPNEELRKTGFTSSMRKTDAKLFIATVDSTIPVRQLWNNWRLSAVSKTEQPRKPPHFTRTTQVAI
jgi:hypothetical protein